ncbi:MAG TPA: LysR family transcriptional regulator, partial [Myxococcota bacterium]
MPLPDLESLACVDALARTLRFHVAAKSCALSPAAFSKRVQQVEDHVGAALFVRTTRTVALTAVGTALVPRIRHMLDEARALRDVDAQHAVTPIDLVLGTRHELGMSWLVPARAAMSSSLPHVTTHLRFGDSDALEAALLQLRLDAVITSRAPSTTTLEAIPLHKED